MFVVYVIYYFFHAIDSRSKPGIFVRSYTIWLFAACESYNAGFSSKFNFLNKLLMVLWEYETILILGVPSIKKIFPDYVVQIVSWTLGSDLDILGLYLVFLWTIFPKTSFR